MSSTTPWLDIAIPTYNRAHVLSLELNTLLDEAEKTGATVSFYDNASDDGTQALLTSIADSRPGVRYHRNPENLGLDRNMLLGVKNACAPYIFWLGDDDAIEPGTLGKIRKILEQTNPNLLLLRMRSQSGTLPQPCADDITYDDPRKFFASHVFEMPFGTTVFHASFAQFLPQSERFIGTYHAYTGLITDALALIHLQGKPTLMHVSNSIFVRSLEAAKSWETYRSDVYLRAIESWFDALDPYYGGLREEKRREFIESSGYTEALRQFESGKFEALTRCQKLLHTSSLELASSKQELKKALKELKSKEAQLKDVQIQNELLTQRFMSVLNGWTRLGWRLMPWTKPRWRHNPLKKNSR